MWLQVSYGLTRQIDCRWGVRWGDSTNICRWEYSTLLHTLVQVRIFWHLSCATLCLKTENDYPCKYFLVFTAYCRHFPSFLLFSQAQKYWMTWGIDCEFLLPAFAYNSNRDAQLSNLMTPLKLISWLQLIFFFSCYLVCQCILITSENGHRHTGGFFSTITLIIRGKEQGSKCSILPLNDSLPLLSWSSDAFFFVK